MGQITSPASGVINVAPTDRESGPGAGAGATGNNSIFLGLNAGKNSTLANFIVIGNNSAIGGVSDAGNNGSVIVGQGNVPAWTGSTNQQVGALTVIGQNNLPVLQHGDSSVVIGQGIMPLYTASSVNSGLQKCVIIGNRIQEANNSTTSVTTSVIIGYLAMQSVGFAGSNMVVIGSNAMATCTGTYADCTVLGFNAHSSVGANNPVQDTIIGSGAAAVGASSGNVCIGYIATTTVSGGTQNVVIGAQASNAGGSNCVLLGFGSRTSANNAGQRSISIGPWAGRTLPATLTDILVIESNDPGGSQRAALYADLAKGNVLLGGSTDAGNRSTFFSTGTNQIGIVNGTRGAGNPTGGGFFYVTGGALHYVGSAGTDTTLAPA